MSHPVTALIEALGDASAQVVDLTQPLSERTPVIQLPPPFANTPALSREVLSRYDDRGPMWAWSVLHIGEHTGTHFDAPAHWVTGKDQPDNTVDTIPIEAFIASACVIDCSAEARDKPDFLLTIDFVKKWEERHGRIPARSWVLMRTDWSKRAKPAEYLNLQEDGAHSPGPDAEVVPWLIKERDVHGFGTESVGTDAGQAQHLDPPYPCHYYMHGNNRYGLQCLTNLDQLPPTGAVVFSAPLKIRSGSGSPLRVLALAPKA